MIGPDKSVSFRLLSPAIRDLSASLLSARMLTDRSADHDGRAPYQHDLLLAYELCISNHRHQAQHSGHCDRGEHTLQADCGVYRKC